jgi:hypothetical protein
MKSLIISLICFSIIGCGNAGQVDVFDQQPENPIVQDASPDSHSFSHPIPHLKLPSIVLPNDAATLPSNFQGSDGGWDDGSTNDAGMKVKLDAAMKTDNNVETDAATEEASSPIVSEASVDSVDSGDEASELDSSSGAALSNEAGNDDNSDASSHCYVSNHNGTNCQPIVGSCQFYCCPIKPCQ